MTSVPDERKVGSGRNIQSDGHIRVISLPRMPDRNASYWIESPNGRKEFTHLLFRFPARFHPPIVRWALGKYGRKGSVVLDPFTGSGTLQVEALTKGISAVGVDIDPVSCLITKAKTTPINPTDLKESLSKLKKRLAANEQVHAEIQKVPGGDVDDEDFHKTRGSLWIPSIPNINHWFRKYVTVDLAAIFDAIDNIDLSKRHRTFFRACAAAIVRRISNADPDPVSGLEVTRIQELRNVKRTIRVFQVFYKKCDQAIRGMTQFWDAVRSCSIRPKAKIYCGDALTVASLMEKEALAEKGFPLLVTSPPYCRAVEYSRRHKLEMYWLDLIRDREEFISLTHKYIGRKLVRERDWSERPHFDIPLLDETIKKIGLVDPHKARTVQHYFSSMRSAIEEFHKVLTKNGTMICIVGNSLCCRVPIRTADFFTELASTNFKLVNRFSYAIRNRYMQYGLWNGDGVKEEHVLVLKPR